MMRLIVSFAMPFFLQALSLSIFAADRKEVEVVEFRSEDIFIDRTYRGVVRSHKVVVIKPEISGILQKKLFVEGAFVKEGQALYKIDDTLARLELIRAEADAEVERSNHSILEREYKKAQQLYAKNNISEAELNDFALRSNVARANYEKNTVLKDIKELQLSRTVVKSPIDGFVETTLLDEGNFVTAGETELVLVRTGGFNYVDFSVPESDYSRFGLSSDHDEGQQRRFFITDRQLREIDLEVVYKQRAVALDNGSIRFRAKIESSDSDVLPGARVDVKALISPSAPGGFIPRSAVRFEAGKSVIFAVDPDGILKKIEVDIVRDFDSRHYVSLPPGISYTAIVTHAKGLSEGMLVEVKKRMPELAGESL